MRARAHSGRASLLAMLLTFTRLTRIQRFDLLSALAGEPIADDRSLSDDALFVEIARTVRDDLGANDGELHGALRAAMTTVGDGIGLNGGWWLGSINDEGRSWDLVSDDQLPWLIGLRIFAEACDVEEWGEIILRDAVGRRVQTRGLQARRQLLVRTAIAPDGDRPLNETYVLVDRVLRGDLSLLTSGFESR